MSCDLGRLHIAIETAREERAANDRFLMRLQRFEVQDPPPPDQTDEEMVEATRSVMAMFRRRAADPDDDDE